MGSTAPTYAKAPATAASTPAGTATRRSTAPAPVSAPVSLDGVTLRLSAFTPRILPGAGRTARGRGGPGDMDTASAPP
ncbi:hypothetical protein GCM10023083_54280 [Streptomyces phyllanthi]